MKEAARHEEKRMTFTAKELAARYRVAPETIRAHGVKLFGAGETGKTRRYGEAEATAILKSIQTPVASGTHSATSTLSLEVETELSLYMEAATLERRSKEIWKRIAEQEKSRADALSAENVKLATAYGREVLDHKATKNLLEEQKLGTAMYQRIAEAAGFVKSDREDVLDTYRRRP